jgi:hypothetical protein
MAKPSITKRTTKAAALTYSELDTNFQNLADATLTLRAGTAGTNVTADLNGTITLVAGTNVTLTGDNSAKTITINSSSGSGTVDSGSAGRLAYYPSTGTTVDDTTALYIDTASPYYLKLGTNLDINGAIIVNNNGRIKINESIIFENSGHGVYGRGSLVLYGDYATSNYIEVKSTSIDLNTVTANFSGTIVSSNASGAATIDRSGVTASYANNATVNFSNFSGMVMINRQDSGSGNVALWLCGSGSASKLGDSNSPTASGTIAANGGVNGYTWTNNTGGTITCSFMTFKGRAGG